jgi:uncharacterized coiled-coil protein SlyX
MRTPADPPNELELRITRLEEALGFAQHENTQLSAEVLALGKRVLDLSRRLDAMDQRLREAAAAKSPEASDADPSSERPPHSAPPLRRESP